MAVPLPPLASLFLGVSYESCLLIVLEGTCSVGLPPMMLVLDYFLLLDIL